MAGFRVEQDLCDGRGFGADALLGRFKAWVVKTHVNGGPNWYILDDQSALGTNPYIVVSSHNAADWDVPAKYMKVTMPTATAGYVYVSFWLWWDSTEHTGKIPYGYFNVPTLDDAEFLYDFRGGPECLFFQTFTVSTWNGCFIDDIVPDPNIIETSVSATTAVANFVGADRQIRAIDCTSGIGTNTDGDGNYYAAIEFVSGSNYRVSVYSDSGRTTLIARSSNFTALAGITNYTSLSVPQNSGSGNAFTFYLRGATAADATIVFRPQKITVGTGEGAQFTEGNYYFIYDLRAQPSVNSFLVVSKSGDVLTIDRLYGLFQSGAKIGGYPHPFLCGGDTGVSPRGARPCIPYFDHAGTGAAFLGVDSEIGSEAAWYELDSQIQFGATQKPQGVVGSIESEYINKLSPDRRGRWVVQHPGIAGHRAPMFSYVLAVNAKCAVGQTKNMIVGSSSGMSVNIHGRTVSGIAYTYFRSWLEYFTMNSGNSYALMFRETEANS